MQNVLFIIQASSTSWSGSLDMNMNLVDGYPVVYHTAKKIMENISEPVVRVIAPKFDNGGELELLKDAFREHDFDIYYGHDDSPLKRMIDVTSCEPDNKCFIRVDGLHCFFDFSKSLEMLQFAEEHGIDCVKFPDDFPVQFTTDVYRVGALRDAFSLIENDKNAGQFKVHPKYYMFHSDSFNTVYLESLPVYDDAFLNSCREKAKMIYREPRLIIDAKKGIAAGDQLVFHYEFAEQYLNKSMKVLDVACGDGYGTRMLSDVVNEVHGVDIDHEVIELAKNKSVNHKNITFYDESVYEMRYLDNEFDAVCSMETIEHVEPESYLKEISRILKPNGMFILSTPQNSLGNIPVNATHLKEYSLSEVASLCSKYFTVERKVGIKAGRVIFEDDPIGQNTILVCRENL